jgi:hypothetical protein
MLLPSCCLAPTVTVIRWSSAASCGIWPGLALAACSSCGMPSASSVSVLPMRLALRSPRRRRSQRGRNSSHSNTTVYQFLPARRELLQAIQDAFDQRRVQGAWRHVREPDWRRVGGDRLAAPTTAGRSRPAPRSGPYPHAQPRSRSVSLPGGPDAAAPGDRPARRWCSGRRRSDRRHRRTGQPRPPPGNARHHGASDRRSPDHTVRPAAVRAPARPSSHTAARPPPYQSHATQIGATPEHAGALRVSGSGSRAATEDSSRADPCKG